MRPYQAACIVVAALLLLEPASIEAKRRKHKGDDHGDSHKTKTKTKWSSSTDLGGGANAQVSTEEHGYYVKRTYTPLTGADGKRKSPPYLGIPIAWFSSDANKNKDCQQISNSGAINSAAHALSEGYLCDDDCEDAYEPICGQTTNEVAVFYNKCKLNVAKCRTHGLWTELPYQQCQQTYPRETAYTDKKFKCSPFFRANSTAATPAVFAEPENDKESKESNESSEEQKDHDKKENQAKPVKEETISMPLQVLGKPVQSVVPVPEPVESIAMPPLPVKAAVTQAFPAEEPLTVGVAQITGSLPEALASTVVRGEKTSEQAEPKSDKDKLKYVVS
ncbi:uncharacterized protein LOC115769435 [Drosophila novamexicana]|uniref:uncharacterized protein LOC115769435 n=1 Tax=Drosophila novamexicana TaxID=47314 RepID=UPI0011E5D581|nr:uncharacterized protein LOC115769435 [Drosophila novamexicana]